jgi:AP-1-like factor
MPFWDVSQTPMTISQIADDDFLTLLQKQFPTNVQIPFDLSFPGYNNPAVVNPQNLSDYTFPISQPTPPSSDSGNSPGSTTNDNDDRSLKRKASEERMDVEPASKTAHTGTSRPTSSPLPSLLGRLTSDSSASRPIKRYGVLWQLQEIQLTPQIWKSNAGTHPVSFLVVLVLIPLLSQDDLRLMKRKEQNRAAQRAFRERKEKHVKDV